jgi:hypothetical protein
LQKSNSSLYSTWDILRHYAELNPEKISSFIDDPQNGMRLESSIHGCYDEFRFCLQPKVLSFLPFISETKLGLQIGCPNTYTIKWFSKPPFFFETFGRKEVTFVDHAENHISLPEPKLLAVHAAISHILHVTGAGEYLDTVLNFATNGTLEERLTHVSLKMSLIHSLQLFSIQ